MSEQVQYWLAELDVHGNPKLIDGAHDSADGAKCVPSAAGVNHDAVRQINNARMRRTPEGGAR